VTRFSTVRPALLGALLFLLALRSAAQAVQWQPVLEMDGQLFPSYVLATAAARLYEPEDEDSTWLGDQNGMLGVRLVNPAAGTTVRLEVNLPHLAEEISVYEGTLERAGETYHIFPTIRYDFDLLAQLTQPRPAAATFTLYLDGRRVGQKTKNFPVRSVNDCPYSFQNLYGDEEDVSWMFAAYVNENHPDVDVLLKEAIETGLVSGVDGYQGAPDDVYKQVFALWTALQRRGIRYSATTRPSGADQKVYSQNVRFMDQTLRVSQAGCVDATVLFASVLRRIEIDPFLVLVPGHCFLGFYLDRDHKEFDLLETTMLGNPTKGTAGKKLTRLYARWFGNDSRHIESWKKFSAAVDDANATYDQYKAKLENPANTDLSCQIIDVEECRKTGVMPIASQPLFPRELPALATDPRVEKGTKVATSTPE
jgi:hypothetical protein